MSTVLTWNIVSVSQDHGDRRTSGTAAADNDDDDDGFDDRLLRVTVWANRTLRGDGGCDNDDNGGGDFAAAYDQVYTAALHGDRTADERLYERIRACVAHHLNDAVAPALERAAGGVELLAVTRRAYTGYERAAGRLADACAYLDALMRRRGRDAEPVRAMARSLFRDMLLRRCDEPAADSDGRDGAVGRAAAAADGDSDGGGTRDDDLMGRLVDAVVRSADVHLWAGHECADAVFCGRTVLAAVAESAATAGLGDSLAKRLRHRFLDEADRRLRAFARSADAAADAYAEAAGRAIDAEAAVALRYGGPAAARAVTARATVLLVAERRAFVVHSDAGLCRMMETGRDPDAVAKVYALLARLSEAAGPQIVADAVGCCADHRLHGRVVGGGQNYDDGGGGGQNYDGGCGGQNYDGGGGQNCDDDDSAPSRVCTDHTRFVGRVMWFRDTMDGYVRRAFDGNAVVARAVEHHVYLALNYNNDAARHLARHINDLIAESSDALLLDRAFDLLQYLDDGAMDIFELNYRSVTRPYCRRYPVRSLFYSRGLLDSESP